MQKIKLALFFILILNFCNAQKKYTSEWLIKTSVGYDMFDVDFDNGHYYKIGVEYKPRKKWRINLHYEHTEINTYLKDFTFSENNYDDTARYFAKYRGMTHGQFMSGKGSMFYLAANIMSLEGIYDICFRKNGRFFMSPKFGINRIRSNSFYTYLSEGYFHNGLLVSGKLSTDISISNFWGVTYGGEFSYQLKPKHTIFIDLEKIADMGRWKDDSYGSYSGRHFYNTWNFGLGYKYKIK